MLKRWAAWPQGIRWLVAGSPLSCWRWRSCGRCSCRADWLAHHDVGSVKGSLHETALDNARGRLLTLGAGLFAAGALVFTARNFTLSRRTFELTEQGQVTDRYTKAIEQLGSDKLDVRIGGIYALERVARDSARDHPTVMEVLTAFIREHSHEPGPDQTLAAADQDTIDTTRRSSCRNCHRPPNLRANDRGCASTSPARTSPAHASPEAVLDGANLTGTNLTARISSAPSSPAQTSPARSSPARTSAPRGPHRRATSPMRISPARILSDDLSGTYLSRRGPHRRQLA